MHELVIAGGKLGENISLGAVNIGVSSGIIEKISRQQLEGERKINAKGMLVFPGFIDIHVHVREDPSGKWNYKEDFLTASNAAINGGVTAMLDQPNNPFPPVDLNSLKEKQELAKKSLIGAFLYAGVGPENLDKLKELEFVAKAYKIFTCESVGPLYFKNHDDIKSAMNSLESIKKPVSFHCEDMAVIEKTKTESLHIGKRPAEAEIEAIRKVLNIVNKKVNFCHVSTKKGFELARNSAFRHTIEATPHHLYFTERDYEKNKFLQMNPPLRSRETRDYLLKALLNNQVDFLATDHAPHTIDEKEQGISGVPHLDTYANFVAWLIEKVKVSPETIAKICCENPSKFLGLENRGQIKEGNIADITILNMKAEKITNEKLETKCAWSPFEGKEMPGRAEHVVVNGKIMKKNNELFF